MSNINSNSFYRQFQPQGMMPPSANNIFSEPQGNYLTQNADSANLQPFGGMTPRFNMGGANGFDSGNNNPFFSNLGDNSDAANFFSSTSDNSQTGFGSGFGGFGGFDPSQIGFGSGFGGFDNIGSSGAGFEGFNGMNGMNGMYGGQRQGLGSTQALFTRLDTDSNGSLSADELNAIGTPPGMTPLTDAEKTTRFNRIDTNDNSKISERELLKARETHSLFSAEATTDDA